MDRVLHDLIRACYETVVAPESWSAFLEQLTTVLDAKGCLLFEVDTAQGTPLRVPLFNESFQNDLLQTYMAFFANYEIAEQARFNALANPADRIELIRDAQLFPDEESRAAQPNVQALGNFGIGHRAFALLDKDNRSRYRFSVQHSGRHGPLKDQERVQLQQILPHMAKALQLGRPLLKREATMEGLVAAMSKLDIGVAILDASGRETYANAEHDRQRAELGTFRKAPDGTLHLSANGDSVRLNALLKDMLRHGQFGARPRREAIAFEGGGHLGAVCLEVCPRPDGGAIIFSFDTSRGVFVDSDVMRRTFGLTQSEAAVLSYVADGLTNTEIAERRGRSPATVNVQIKSVLAKTRCTNRTQLARLMMNFGSKIEQS